MGVLLSSDCDSIKKKSSYYRRGVYHPTTTRLPSSSSTTTTTTTTCLPSSFSFFHSDSDFIRQTKSLVEEISQLFHQFNTHFDRDAAHVPGGTEESDWPSNKP